MTLRVRVSVSVSLCRHEFFTSAGETSRCVVEDALGARFVGEDEVSNVICNLDSILEQQEDFDAANDMVV